MDDAWIVVGRQAVVVELLTGMMIKILLLIC